MADIAREVVKVVDPMPLRVKLAELIAVDATGDIVAAVLPYRLNHLKGKTPVIMVPRSGIESPQLTAKGVGTRIPFEIISASVLSDSEHDWTEQDCADRMDKMAVIITSVIATNRKCEGFWKDLQESIRSQTSYIKDVSGETFMTETFFVEMEAHSG